MDKETNKMKLAYWTNVIRESKSSGMKITEWCEMRQISLRKYYYWHKKVMHGTYALAVENGYLSDTDDIESMDKLPSIPEFAELSVPNASDVSERSDDCRISIKKSGFTIEVGSSFSEGGLLRVLRVIQNV